VRPYFPSHLAVPDPRDLPQRVLHVAVHEVANGIELESDRLERREMVQARVRKGDGADTRAHGEEKVASPDG
jgi:hypothetical protein